MRFVLRTSIRHYVVYATIVATKIDTLCIYTDVTCMLNSYHTIYTAVIMTTMHLSPESFLHPLALLSRPVHGKDSCTRVLALLCCNGLASLD